MANTPRPRTVLFWLVVGMNVVWGAIVVFETIATTLYLSSRPNCGDRCLTEVSWMPIVLSIGLLVFLALANLVVWALVRVQHRKAATIVAATVLLLPALMVLISAIVGLTRVQ